MKRFFPLFAIVTLSSFLLAGCGSQEDLQAKADLQAKVEELQARLEDLQTQSEGYSALKSELDSVQKSTSDLQAKLDATVAEKEAMSAKLEALYYIEPMEETMYTTAEAKAYKDLFDEALGNEAAGTLQAGQEVTVTGKSNVTGWYAIKTGDADDIQFVSGGLLSATKPQAQAQKQQTKTQQPKQQQQAAEEDDEVTDEEWAEWAASTGTTLVGPPGSNGIGPELHWQ